MKEYLPFIITFVIMLYFYAFLIVSITRREKWLNNVRPGDLIIYKPRYGNLSQVEILQRPSRDLVIVWDLEYNMKFNANINQIYPL